MVSVDGKLIQWGLGAYFCAKDFFIHENNWILRKPSCIVSWFETVNWCVKPSPSLPPLLGPVRLCSANYGVYSSLQWAREPTWLPNHRGRGTNPLSEASPDWHCPCRSPKWPPRPEESYIYILRRWKNSPLFRQLCEISFQVASSRPEKGELIFTVTAFSSTFSLPSYIPKISFREKKVEQTLEVHKVMR